MAGGPKPLDPIEYPSWLGQPLGGGEAAAAATPRLDDAALEARLAELKRVDDDERIRQSRERDKAFLQRKEDNERLLAEPGRLDRDMASVGVTREQYDLMVNGDPRLPLGFESQAQLAEFKADIEQTIASIQVDGQPITVMLQVMGSSTSFYSGNPDKDLGHHWDRAGHKESDYDIDVISPELVKAMLQNPEASANDKVLRDGERVIFRSTGVGGFYQTFPQFEALARRWEEKLGRDFEFKLKMDLTPVAQQPPAPPGGAIPLTRKE